MKAKEEEIQKAFEREDDIYRQHYNLSHQKGIESFWSTHQYEIDEKKSKRIGDIWEYTKLINGREPYIAYSVWRDATKYNQQGNCLDDDKIAAILKESQFEIVLYKSKNYRISLLRTKVRKPTENHWGYKILGAEYALIDNKNNILQIDAERWRFKLKALELLKTSNSNSVMDNLRKINPFKIKVVKSTDIETIKKLSEKLDFAIDTPDRYDFIDRPNLWVVFIMGLHNKVSKETGSTKYANATWFYYEGKKEPTHLQALEQLMKDYKFYKGCDPVTVLYRLKVDKKVNLNKIDLFYEEFKTKAYNEKFARKFARVFGVSFATLHNTILPKEEPIYNRWQIHKDRTRTPLPNEPVDTSVLTVFKDKIF